jgi:hypothetical protein
MGATPQLPRAVTDLVGWMKGIESQISLLHERMNNPLANTGLTVPSAGVVQVDGQLNVNGPMAVTGTLSLPAGIINNDALTNPITPVSLHADATNFSPTPGAGIAAMSVSATVPTGYTQALLFGLYASAGAVNSTAATDFLYVQISSVGGTVLPGWQVPSTSTPAGAYANAFQQGTLLKTGLTGGSTLTISARISTSVATWAANTSNVANLDVSILFLR